MTTTKYIFEITIVHWRQVPEDKSMLVLGKLITGDLIGICKGESDIIFHCLETGGKWEFTAAPILSARERETINMRSFGIEHVEGSRDLREGYTLAVEE